RRKQEACPLHALLHVEALLGGARQFAAVTHVVRCDINNQATKLVAIHVGHRLLARRHSTATVVVDFNLQAAAGSEVAHAKVAVWSTSERHDGLGAGLAEDPAAGKGE